MKINVVIDDLVRFKFFKDYVFARENKFLFTNIDSNIINGVGYNMKAGSVYFYGSELNVQLLGRKKINIIINDFFFIPNQNFIDSFYELNWPETLALTSVFIVAFFTIIHIL